MERRILGSIYGSSRPERDFPALLELYLRGRLPLDRLVSQRMPLDSVQDAFAAMPAALPCAWCSTWRARMTDPLDGRIGEAWSGEVPNGSHINVVLARRGSPTAAAAAGALAGPRPGHVPFLACLSPGVVVRPATIVVNKSPVDGDVGPITWGAAQLGIAQGVLDAVADGLIDAGRGGRGGRARRRSGSIPPRMTRPRSSGRTARPCAARSPTRCSRRPRRNQGARRAPRGSGEHLLHGRMTCKSPRSRSGATACRSTLRSTPPGTPSRARGARRRW